MAGLHGHNIHTKFHDSILNGSQLISGDRVMNVMAP